MESPDFASRPRLALYWLGVWFAGVLLLVGAGALLGAALWGAFGKLLGSELDAPRRLAYGADVGWRYARVWAGGVAFVLCFVKAHERFSLRARWRARRR